MVSRPWLAKPCRDAAVKIMQVAQAGAPVGNPAEDTHPGLYKASFDVVPTVKNVPFRGKPRQRFGAQVINTAPHAWRVEKGDGRVPRYAPLQTAVDTVKAAHGG
ncbi:hypothetical protein CP967_31110 [Streptomyces nitrosporeus]|uniref:HK97 gp10 family phage protein n=2 Tax=Streptomyces nitrosporeus TaxID=28894 RepID=A0A5J6FM97_9ACTN|nr:hypothetical protein CP967_31110 [Streptomyces nitrosporeus]